MVLSNGATSVVATVLSLIIFAILQIFKPYIVACKFLILFSGFISSFIFVFLLTAFNNCEQLLFGKGFQSQLFPEVTISLIISCIAACTIHRICMTVCFCFSVVGLYYLNTLSQSAYAVSTLSNKKKKN